MIRLIKYILNKRKPSIKARLERVENQAKRIDNHIDYLCNDIAYWKELMFKLSERLERVEHSSMPTYSMKRMLRDKELNSK
jgi:hypothetical protein